MENLMKTTSRAIIAAAVLATAGLAYAETDGNSSGTTLSNRVDPSQMTTAPEGATPDVSTQRDSEFNRSRNAMYNRTTRHPADPSQMNTHPSGATPSGGTYDNRD
jgi:hypothetical protein